jgi:hypothetical protein
MTSTSLDQIQNGHQQMTPRVAGPSRVGQGTAVEQSRAVAEVEAAIVVALRHPRDMNRAVTEMQRSCAQKSLAEKAFFRYSRGGGQISGPSVQLARELGRCFGNLQYGITELRRDDEYGQSEMQAWAWDVQTNTRSSTTFVVPHIRDTKQGPKQLVETRDIYELNANMGARRLREMIFAILPGWFTEDAVAACYRTLEGDDSDIAERRDKCLAGFARFGVIESQLVQKLGSPADKWTSFDLATLTVIYRSLERGEIRKEDEFESATERLTAADITGQQAPPAATPAAPAPAAPQAKESAAKADPAPARGGNGASRLGKLLTQIPLGTADDISEFIAWRTGREGCRLADMSADEVAASIELLEKALETARGDADAAASAVWTAYKDERADKAEQR